MSRKIVQENCPKETPHPMFYRTVSQIKVKNIRLYLLTFKQFNTVPQNCPVELPQNNHRVNRT